MNDTKKMMITQSLDSLLPFALSMLPSDQKDKHICSIIYDGLKSFNTESAKKLAQQIVYDDNSSGSPFNALLSICEYLNELASTEQNKKNIKIAKQLNVVLSLPSNMIIEKNIDFKLANVDVSKTIKQAIANGYSYEMCDKVLHFIHTLIFKFLSLKVSEISISDLCNTIDNIGSVN